MSFPLFTALSRCFGDDGRGLRRKKRCVDQTAKQRSGRSWWGRGQKSVRALLVAARTMYNAGNRGAKNPQLARHSLSGQVMQRITSSTTDKIVQEAPARKNQPNLGSNNTVASQAEVETAPS